MTESQSSHPGGLLTRLGRIGRHFSRPRTAWVVAILATITMSLTEPLIPALLQPLLDHGFQQRSMPVWLVPAALIGLFGVRGLAGFIAQMALAKLTTQGLLGLRTAMFDRLQQAKLSLFSQQSSSALANTIVYEVQTGSSLLVSALMTLTRDSVTLLALLSYLMYLNWKLTLIVAGLFPAVAFVMRTLSRRLYRLTKTSQTATDELAYVVEENVLANRDIRVQGAQQAQSERFFVLADGLRRLSMKATAAGSAMTPLTQVLAAVALSCVISVALLQSADQSTTVGSFVAFVTAMLMLVAPLKHLSELASPITRGLAALERGLDLIDNIEIETSGNFSTDRATGLICFERLRVQFNDSGPPAVDDFSLTIEPGETVALVGASGAGKTTLANLLPRFVEASAGAVLVDGHDVRDWKLGSLRQQLALVSQHVVMLSGSLASNVTLGQPLDRQRVRECLVSANLEGFLAELPSGIDTEVGHNAMQLSGGQRQRLAIARALYKDAPILILDEATSALDAESERAVQEALERLMQNRTTLVIAHRLSTVQHADRIVVMAGGRIVESGRPSELLRTDGHYARLFRAGFGHANPNPSSNPTPSHA